MTVALVDVASDDVGGEPDGHCEPTSAAVSVGGGGTYARTLPCGGTGPKSGNGGAGFLASRGGRVLGGVSGPVLYGIMRLKSKKLVNKFGVIGRILSNGPEVVMSGREVEKIDTGPGFVEVGAPRGGGGCTCSTSVWYDPDSAAGQRGQHVWLA